MRPFSQVCRKQSRSHLCINFILKNHFVNHFCVFWPILTVQFSKSLLFTAIYFSQVKINSGPLISHFFKITNHRSICFCKYLFIFKSLFDWHRSIDYRFALLICPQLAGTMDDNATRKQILHALAASCMQSRQFFASTLREQLVEKKNEDAIRKSGNIRNTCP